MKAFIIILVCCCFAACAVKSFGPIESAIPAMQQKVPGITMERARQGYQLYAGKCASCHRLYPPSKFSITAWNNILPTMFPKAKISDKVTQRLVSDYVHSLSK